MTFVGMASSMAGVERRCAGVSSGRPFRLLYLADPVFGVDLFEFDLNGLDFFGVDIDLEDVVGEDACLFTADSRRSRAGRTRLSGMLDDASLLSVTSS